MDTATAYETLRRQDRAALEAMMLACAGGHVALCSITSQEVDPHATPGLMRERITAMSVDEMAQALSGFASLGELVHEHHEGHGDHSDHEG